MIKNLTGKEDPNIPKNQRKWKASDYSAEDLIDLAFKVVNQNPSYDCNQWSDLIKVLSLKLLKVKTAQEFFEKKGNSLELSSFMVGFIGMKLPDTEENILYPASIKRNKGNLDYRQSNLLEMIDSVFLSNLIKHNMAEAFMNAGGGTDKYIARGITILDLVDDQSFDAFYEWFAEMKNVTNMSWGAGCVLRHSYGTVEALKHRREERSKIETSFNPPQIKCEP